MQRDSVEQNASIGWIGAVVSVYAWMAAVVFGLVVLDVVYARLLQDAFAQGVVSGIFNEISDFLVLPLALLVLVGLIALVAGRGSGTAAKLVLASWLVIVGSIPLAVLLAPMLDAAGLGTLFRLTLSGSASVLAMLGALCYRALAVAPSPA